MQSSGSKDKAPEDNKPEGFQKFPKEIQDLLSQLNSERLVLAERLDIYYHILKICDQTINAEASQLNKNLTDLKENAISFMEKVLDVKGRVKIDNLMKDRAEVIQKSKNKEYIPKKAYLNISHIPSRLRSNSANQYKLRKLSELAIASRKEKVLLMNPESKVKDTIEKNIMLSPVSRDKYRVIIYDGLFYERKQGDVFNFVDTSDRVSKNKPGYVSYVISIDGEISIFEHKAKQLYHSSMQRGGAVLSAGEMLIDNGNLIEISPFSGHYKPTPKNMFITLNYLQEQKVDISNVRVILLERERGKNIVPIEIRQMISQTGEVVNRFVYKATDILKSYALEEKNELIKKSHRRSATVPADSLEAKGELTFTELNDVSNIILRDLKLFVNQLIKSFSDYESKHSTFNAKRIKFVKDIKQDLQLLLNSILNSDKTHYDFHKKVMVLYKIFCGNFTKAKLHADKLGIGKEKKGKVSALLKTWEKVLGTPPIDISSYFFLANKIIQSKYEVTQLKNKLQNSVNQSSTNYITRLGNFNDQTLQNLNMLENKISNISLFTGDINEIKTELENIAHDIAKFQNFLTHQPMMDTAMNLSEISLTKSGDFKDITKLKDAQEIPRATNTSRNEDHLNDDHKALTMNTPKKV